METARIFKTYKFRLYPTDEQAARLDQWFASGRWIYKGITNTLMAHMACLSMHSHLKRILSRSRSFIRANGGN